MNTTLIATCAAQASRAVVLAPTGAGFQGRGVSAAGMTVESTQVRLVPTGTDLLPTWHKRPNIDRYIRLRAPQV
jgi:hypothetical protein